MKTVDTNVLLRILINDEKQMEQVKVARHWAKKVKQLFVPQIVQAELVWVLDVSYRLAKEEIIPILSHLRENEAFSLENERVYAVALQLFQEHHADFSDCLIWARSRSSEYDIVTFDKKFGRLPHVQLLMGH